MGFWSWHYSFGIKFYLHQYKSNLQSVVQYFSLPLLVKSLFAPWKKLIINEKTKGFNITEYFNVISFNLVSRIVGFIARLFLLITGSFILIFFAISGALGLILWYVFPFLSYSIFERYKKNPEVIAQHIMNHFQHSPDAALDFILNEDPGIFLTSHLGVSAQDLKENAQLDRVNFEDPSIYTSFEQIIRHLIENEVWTDNFFVKHHLRQDDLINTAIWWDNRSKKHSHVNFDPPEVKAGIGKDLLVGYTPTLDKFGEDIGDTSKSYHLIGRTQLISRVERALTGGSSVILTGLPGVGKTTVVLEFAKQAMYGKLGSQMAYRRIVEVDLNAVASESSDLNQKKVFISSILAEAAGAGNIILVLKDLHRYTNSEVERVDFTDIFEHYLEKKDLKIIAVSTTVDYERFLARNSRLRKFFETIEVVEPTKEDAMQILLQSADEFESKYKVLITTPTLRRIINASAQYITDVPFPEKAIELLLAVITYHQQTGKKSPIGFQEAEIVISERTGVPVSTLTDSKKQQLTNLESVMHKRLIEQDEAISLISKILRSKSSGVVNSTRPIGSFLFLGPTGVGKTETAKVLARVYFGSEKSILRFDMAEFAGKEGIERLIGSQASNQPGMLTNAIKNNPASLLLLDEFEKAPPAIYNLFLRMLDEGKITDAFGNTISCSNLFIIATSNAGAEYIRDLVNQNKESELQEKVTDYIMKNGMFSPEFVNRFDGVVVYKPLSKVAIKKIAEILLVELAEGIHQSKNIAVRFSNDAVEKIATEGFKPEFGARPMRRLIDLQIGDLIGSAILNGEITSGDRISILASEGNGNFKYEKL